ncbi:MauE/DoxX family redox-associated membrane protein [Chitinophaga sp.]|uniref:MauE/DoxX family redox-associated membrane protein n=1 Tax=Chitinophaga sp. TaxID=1869181 RepID=UPI0031D56259
MTRKWTLESITMLLFILFTYAAGSKLANYKLFLFQMDAQPFDNQYTLPLAVGLLLMEFAIAACLIFKRTIKAGLWASLSMLIAFTAYIILIKLNYFGSIPCSCGGVIERLSWTQHLFFNLFFIGINIAGIVLYKLPPSAPQQPQLKLS